MCPWKKTKNNHMNHRTTNFPCVYLHLRAWFWKNHVFPFRQLAKRYNFYNLICLKTNYEAWFSKWFKNHLSIFKDVVLSNRVLEKLCQAIEMTLNLDFMMNISQKHYHICHMLTFEFKSRMQESMSPSWRWSSVCWFYTNNNLQLLSDP